MWKFNVIFVVGNNSDRLNQPDFEFLAIKAHYLNFQNSMLWL